MASEEQHNWIQLNTVLHIWDFIYYPTLLVQPTLRLLQSKETAMPQHCHFQLAWPKNTTSDLQISGVANISWFQLSRHRRSVLWLPPVLRNQSSSKILITLPLLWVGCKVWAPHAKMSSRPEYNSQTTNLPNSIPHKCFWLHGTRSWLCTLNLGGVHTGSTFTRSTHMRSIFTRTTSAWSTICEFNCACDQLSWDQLASDQLLREQLLPLRHLL